MATNPPKGDNHRQGAVKDRTQTFNPKTEQWVKRDTDNGRFMELWSKVGDGVDQEGGISWG